MSTPMSSMHGPGGFWTRFRRSCRRLAGLLKELSRSPFKSLFYNATPYVSNPFGAIVGVAN
jgi:hypothetical protein